MVEASLGSFEILSPAKLNLYFDVIGKREDGYHEIVGLFQTISMFDRMWVTFTKEGIIIESNVYIENNIIEMTYSMFKKTTGKDFGVKVKLEKRIPIGAGLGGGSSNAGAFLRFLGRYFDIPEDELLFIAKNVGSDVPFFLYGGTAIVRGRGDIVEPLKTIEGYSVDVAFPGFSISTASMYDLLKKEDWKKGMGDPYELYEAFLKRDIPRIKELSYNVFQNLVFQRYPDVKETYELLRSRDPIVTMVTGTGSSVFALFEGDIGTYRFTGGEGYGS